MKMITGYLQASSGKVSVNKIDVNTHPIEAKKQMGYLPEGNPLYYEMYVREYLEFMACLHQINPVKKRIEEVKMIVSG